MSPAQQRARDEILNKVAEKLKGKWNTGVINDLDFSRVGLDKKAVLKALIEKGYINEKGEITKGLSDIRNFADDAAYQGKKEQIYGILKKAQDLGPTTLAYLNDLIGRMIVMADTAKYRTDRDNRINAAILSLAMSGGKTVMEEYVAEPLLEYIRKTNQKGLIIIKSEDLVNKMMDGKEGNPAWTRFDRAEFTKNGNKFEEGKVIVMSYKQAFEAGLTYKDGTTKGRNPFEGYVAMVDEVHELALSVPMITSPYRNESDILRSLGPEGRALRARERGAQDVFMQTAKQLLQMREKAIEAENPGLSTEETHRQAYTDLTQSQGDSSARLNMNNRFIVTGDGMLITPRDKGADAYNKEEWRAFGAILRERFSNNPDLDHDTEARDKFLPHFEKFTDALAQVWNNERFRQSFYGTEYKDGKFTLITKDTLGREDRERVFTDNAGLNAFMKMIIAWHDVNNPDGPVKESEYIRTTERNLHTQITALELMSLIPGFVGYTGTAEVAQAVLKLKAIQTTSHGLTMDKGMFNERQLKLFKGSYEDEALSAVKDWFGGAVIDKHMANVLLLNMGNKESREKTVELLKNTFGNSVEIIEAGPEGFSNAMEKDINKPEYYGKRVIVVSSGESGASPDRLSVRMWHYDFDIRAMYAHVQAMARSDRLRSDIQGIWAKDLGAALKGTGISVEQLIKNGYIEQDSANKEIYKVNTSRVNQDAAKGVKSAQTVKSMDLESLEIRRAKGVEYKQFINVDEHGHDSRLSDVQSERLRLLMNASLEDQRMAVDQAMEELQLRERQRAMIQSVASVKTINRDVIGEQLHDMQDEFITKLVQEYVDPKTGTAKVYYGVNGSGYNVYSPRVEGDMKRYAPVAIVAMANGTGIADQDGHVYLNPGEFMAPNKVLSGARVYSIDQMDAYLRGVLPEDEKEGIATLVRGSILNPIQTPDAPLMVNTWLRGTKATDAKLAPNGYVLKVNTQVPVISNGVQTGVQNYTYIYKYEPNAQNNELLAVMDEKGQSIGNVSQTRSTAEGYQYNIVSEKGEDGKDETRAVLFEGVLYKLARQKEQAFSAIISEQAETSDLRHEKLHLKLHLAVQNGTVSIQGAEVANEASLLLVNGSFKKGDKVSITIDENKEKNIKVIGRGAALMKGRIYDITEEGIKQDRAEVKINVGGETRRVQGVEAQPVKGSGYGRGRFAIHDEEFVKTQGFDTIDYAAGLLLKQGAVVGKFLNDTAYVLKDGRYSMEENDMLAGLLRSEDVDVSVENGKASVSKSGMEKFMKGYYGKMEQLKYLFQQFSATAGVDFGKAQAFKEFVAGSRIFKGMTVRIHALDANNKEILGLED